MDTTQFLAKIFCPEEVIDLRMIGENSVFDKYVQFGQDTGEQIAAIIAQYQPEYSIYYGVNPRQKLGESKLVSRLTCAFVDIDAKDFPSYDEFKSHCELLKEKLSKINLLPSAAVQSGHGLHLYWFFKGSVTFTIGIDEAGHQTCPAWKELQRALIHFCNSDRKIHDLPRIMRLPGSLNVKDHANPKPCKLLFFEQEREYAKADFKHVLAIPDGAQDASKNKTRSDILFMSYLLKCNYFISGG